VDEWLAKAFMSGTVRAPARTADLFADKISDLLVPLTGRMAKLSFRHFQRFTPDVSACSAASTERLTDVKYYILPYGVKAGLRNAPGR
jgi:hypothetical protein